MLLRDVVKSDVLDIVQNLDDFKFPIPKLEDCEIKASIEDKGNLLGIGAIKLVGEITILLKPNVSNFKRTKAIKMLFDKALIESNKLNINQWYAFVDDDKWADEIQRHYGFTHINRKGYSLEL